MADKKKPPGQTYFRCMMFVPVPSALNLDFVITIVLVDRFLAGPVCRGIHLGRNGLVDAVGILAHPTELQLEVFVLQLIVHLVDAEAK